MKVVARRSRISRDPEIFRFIPKSYLKISTPLLTYKVTPLLFAKFLNFKSFVNDRNLDIFPCECNVSTFNDRHYKHIVAEYQWIIKMIEQVQRKNIIKEPKYIEVRPVEAKHFSVIF